MYELISDPSFRRKADLLLSSGKPLDQLIAGFCYMEADMVDALLGETRSCNNTSRDAFYRQMSALFAYCESKRDRNFRVYAAMCINESCNTYDKRSFVFVADHTGNYIGLTFNLERDRILYFKECCSICTPVAIKSTAKRLYLSELPF